MFLFGMAWLFGFLLIAGLGLFLYNLHSRVKKMEKNYEGSTLEAMKRNIAQLEQTVNSLLQARK